MCKPWECSWRRQVQILRGHSGFYKCVHEIASWAKLIFLQWTVSSQLEGSTPTPWWRLTESFWFTHVDGLQRLIWIYRLSLDKNLALNFRELHFSWVKWEPQAWSAQHHDEVWVGSWMPELLSLSSSLLWVVQQGHAQLDGFNCKSGLRSCTFACVSFKLSCKFSERKIIQSETPARLLGFSS